ncbi:hypothetical protein [Halopseudomonas sp.]|uniref:hypothetical protein n=1 Tax=Halopseudomonas sp. TaxID=2901191 RepID=UPI0030033E9B
MGFPVCSALILLGMQTLSIDLITGALFTNFTNSFFVRTIGIIFISIFPAYLLCSLVLRWDYKKVLDVASIAFWIQLGFWILTFLYPGLKFSIVAFMGGGADSVNLRDHNLEVRGFGVSTEMNYTTPFMTVLVCLLFLKSKSLGLMSTLTQLVNSNLVLVAAAIGLWFSKISWLKKILLLLLAAVFLFVFGEVVFPRFFQEFESGDARTVTALYSEHLFLINDGFLSHVFGEFEYVFQGGAGISSDIGWVHIYSYGGVVFTVMFLLFLLALCLAAFGRSYLGLVWFLAGLVLNAKGLLYGPNSYYFMTFIFIFLRHSPLNAKLVYSKRRKNEI